MGWAIGELLDEEGGCDQQGLFRVQHSAGVEHPPGHGAAPEPRTGHTVLRGQRCCRRGIQTGMVGGGSVCYSNSVTL